MKKLSIVLLLIAFSITTIEASVLSKQRIRFLVLKTWDNESKSSIPIPIEAFVEDKCIIVRFTQSYNSQVSIQIKGNDGDIIFQDIVIANPEETYKINLKENNAGKYKLYYLDERIEISGTFYIE